MKTGTLTSTGLPGLIVDLVWLEDKMTMRTIVWRVQAIRGTDVADESIRRAVQRCREFGWLKGCRLGVDTAYVLTEKGRAEMDTPWQTKR